MQINQGGLFMKCVTTKKIMAGLILPPLMFTCGVSLGKNVSASNHHNTMPTRHREELVNRIYEGLGAFEKQYDRTQDFIENKEEEEDWETVGRINDRRFEYADKVNDAVNFNGTFNDGTTQKDWKRNFTDPLSQQYNDNEFLVGVQLVEDWAPGGKAYKAVVENRYYFPNGRLEEAPGIIKGATDDLKKYNDSLYGNNGQ